jgi:hypothetical protein
MTTLNFTPRRITRSYSCFEQGKVPFPFPKRGQYMGSNWRQDLCKHCLLALDMLSMEEQWKPLVCIAVDDYTD